MKIFIASMFVTIISVIVLATLITKCDGNKRYERKVSIVRITDSIIVEKSNLKREDSLRIEISKINKKYKNLLNNPVERFYRDTIRIDSLYAMAHGQRTEIKADSTEINRLYGIVDLQDKRYCILEVRFDSACASKAGYWRGLKHGGVGGFVLGYGLGIATKK